MSSTIPPHLHQNAFRSRGKRTREHPLAFKLQQALANRHHNAHELQRVDGNRQEPAALDFQSRRKSSWSEIGRERGLSPFLYLHQTSPYEDGIIRQSLIQRYALCWRSSSPSLSTEYQWWIILSTIEGILSGEHVLPAENQANCGIEVRPNKSNKAEESNI